MKLLAGFTRESGPRTCVIQRRLRSVYGFDEVEIRSHYSETSVCLKRPGEKLRPTGHFSQSQQQTIFTGPVPDGMYLQTMVRVFARVTG